MDIEERCRERARTYGDLRRCSQTAITLDAAADELATLRAKLAEIADVAPVGSDAHRLALAALTGDDNAEG